MAKKVLTPEEVQTKMEKKSAKRKLFFGTFTKALAFFLAIAMAYSLAIIAFTPATAPAASGSVQSGDVQSGDQGGDDAVDFGGDSGTASTPSGDSGSASTPSGDSGSASTPSGDSNKPSGGQQSTDNGLADAIKLVNDVTAKASKGNYHWERESYYTRDLEVDGKSFLDGIIQMVDPNASVASVVGGFLDITGKGNFMTADVKNGQLAVGMKDNPKFLMIASKITEADVKQFKVEGNKYMFQLNACNNPQKDGKNALNHVTNDFITLTEVQEGVAGALGAAGNLLKVESCDVDFTSIVVTAVIDGGNLKSVQISYSMNVKALNLKATLIPITGKGAGDMICTYSNFS